MCNIMEHVLVIPETRLTLWGLSVNSGKLVTVFWHCVTLINFIYSEPKVFHIFVFSTNSATTAVNRCIYKQECICVKTCTNQLSQMFWIIEFVHQGLGYRNKTKYCSKSNYKYKINYKILLLSLLFLNTSWQWEGWWPSFLQLIFMRYAALPDK